MADIAEKAQQQQEGQKNFLGMLFSTPFHFLGVMFGSLLGAIVSEVPLRGRPADSSPH